VLSTEQITNVVHQYAAAQCAGDLDAVVALFATDAVVADPVHEPVHVGSDAIRAFFEGTQQMSDSLDLQITGPVRAVDRFAAVPMRAVSTIGDIRVAVDIVDVFTFGEDGLIGDMKAYWDPAAITTLD
jgi:steroid delta-isomerase